MSRHMRVSASILALAFALPVFAADKGAGSAPPPPAPETPTTKVAEVGTVTAIRSDIKAPEKKAGKGGGPSPYPFDGLEIGQSFGVVGKSKKNMNSTVHSANKKYRVPTTDANGAVVTTVKSYKAKDGTTKNKTVELFTTAREFIHFDVDAKTDPDGASVRVLRTK